MERRYAPCEIVSHNSISRQLVAPPVLGFFFSASYVSEVNIYNAVSYTRMADDLFQ